MMLHKSLAYISAVQASCNRNIIFILHFFIIAPKNATKSVNLPIDKLGFIM